jgi:hypothetical protein
MSWVSQACGGQYVHIELTSCIPCSFVHFCLVNVQSETRGWSRVLLGPGTLRLGCRETGDYSSGGLDWHRCLLALTATLSSVFVHGIVVGMGKIFYLS